MAVAIAGVHYHMGIATRDLDEAMASVGALFGLSWSEVIDGATSPAMSTGSGELAGPLRRAVHSMGGPMRVELLEGGPGSVWETEDGAALHHLAYWVDDLRGTIDELCADGWTVELTIADAAGHPSMFAYLTRPGHARLELTESSRRAETLERLGWAQWDDQLR